MPTVANPLAPKPVRRITMGMFNELHGSFFRIAQVGKGILAAPVRGLKLCLRLHYFALRKIHFLLHTQAWGIFPEHERNKENTYGNRLLSLYPRACVKPCPRGVYL